MKYTIETEVHYEEMELDLSKDYDRKKLSERLVELDKMYRDYNIYVKHDGKIISELSLIN